MGWPRPKKPTIANMGMVAPERTTMSGRLRQCPVSCRRPTRMLEATFRRMCAKNQEEEGSYCRDMCRGLELPAEIEFIVLNDELQQRGNDMGNVNRKSGVCLICGQKKIVERVAGIEACSVCTFVARAVKNTPELVIGEMLRQHGAECFPVKKQEVFEVAETVPSAADTMVERIITTYNLEPGSDVRGFVDNLAAEVEEYKRQARAATEIIETVRGLLDCPDGQSIIEEVTAMERERKKATDTWFETLEVFGASVACTAESLPEYAREIMGELQALREWKELYEDTSLSLKILDLLGKGRDADPVFELGLIMDELHTLRDAVPVGGVLESTGNGRDAVLLDLALDVLAGNVQGLDAARISALR